MRGRAGAILGAAIIVSGVYELVATQLAGVSLAAQLLSPGDHAICAGLLVGAFLVLRLVVALVLPALVAAFAVGLALERLLSCLVR